MRIDLSTIQGYESMTPEEKLAALEGFEFDTTEWDSLRETAKTQKALIDKYTGEIGALKKKEKEGLSEADRRSREQEETLAALQEKYDALLKRTTISDYTARYMALGYSEELAAEAAEALANGEMDKVFASGEKHRADLDRKQKAEATKATPKLDGRGSGTKATTREDIMKIKDDSERQAAIAEHIELFTKEN